ncbi:CRISPR-associated endonuclease Cas1 [Methanothrix sp.]|uniref:CRISPR-associated endonuclease Cas1 n=1 Tax=Methanothrix sp. TaxID=90426 RepID=UPI0034E28B25
MTKNFSWISVIGHGYHMKATVKEVTITRDREMKRIPLESVDHLLIVGMHNVHTSVIVQLLRQGKHISFFDNDAKPVAYLRPYGYVRDDEVRSIQRKTPVHRFALEVCRSAMRARIQFIEEFLQNREGFQFYMGELDLFHRSLEEVKYLVRIEELKRLQRLTSDMYYEVLARTSDPALRFRRRTERPHQDPVNALLSVGYSILYGACYIEVMGAHLDPDIGLFSEGEGSLVEDLIEPFKPRMVDRVVMEMVWEGISAADFECSGVRCHLSDTLVNRLSDGLRKSIDRERLHQCVQGMRDSLLQSSEFVISY